MKLKISRAMNGKFGAVVVGNNGEAITSLVWFDDVIVDGKSLAELAGKEGREKKSNKELQKKLISLREKVDEILKDAHKKKDSFTGSINWGDLHCVEALYCIDEEGTETYRVLVEEAAPDNYDLNMFVVEQLSERFEANIMSFTSRTEW